MAVAHQPYKHFQPFFIADTGLPNQQVSVEKVIYKDGQNKWKVGAEKLKEEKKLEISVENDRHISCQGCCCCYILNSSTSSN